MSRLNDEQLKLKDETLVKLPVSKLVRSQKKTFIKQHDEGFIKCNIRWDDNCGNGKNSFAIGGEINKNKNFTERGFISGGCIHEEIEKYFPEFKHLIKYHLFDSNGPIYYLENTLYFVDDRDCWGKRKGEVKSYKTVVYFDNVPIAHKLDDLLIKAIESDYDFNGIEIESYSHTDKNGYKFQDHYTFKGFYKRDQKNWYGCLFSSLKEAEETRDALNNCTIHIKKIPDSWGEGKERELDKARNSAYWQDAEIDDFTPEKLLERLPRLMNEFKKDIETIGFEY